MKKSSSPIEKAASLILNADYVVALTGAGISVESGIPPFRGPGGIWTRFGEPSMDGFMRFQKNPKRYWEERLKRRRRGGLTNSIKEAKPNPGHYALAEMEAIGVVKTLITQNIDDLHIAAGSRNVLEIHGNTKKVRCISCGKRFLRKTFDLSQLPPVCPNCGGLIKGDTVMFGEPIPVDVLQRCYDEVDRCTCMMIIGTSAFVLPAASLPLHVKKKGGTLIEINPNPTEISHICDLNIVAPSGKVLPELVSTLKSKMEI
jgi:NAD-dependent deacetylase